MLNKNKRGVALMVAYALLVVIAVGVSVVVYPYLKETLPLDNAECPNDLNLIVDSAICDIDTEELTVTLVNRGLFSVPAAYIRLGEPGRKVRFQVNPDAEQFPTGPIVPNGELPIGGIDIANELATLDYSNGLILEIQPAIFEDNKLVPCENGVITQTIGCGSFVGGGVCGNNIVEGGEACDDSASPMYPVPYTSGLCSDYDGMYIGGNLGCSGCTLDTVNCTTGGGACTPDLCEDPLIPGWIYNCYGDGYNIPNGTACGDCGSACLAGEVCVLGYECAACVDDCSTPQGGTHECGPSNCGTADFCSTCPAGEFCNYDPGLEETFCDPFDPCFVDGFCDGGAGETCFNCPDCACPPGAMCLPNGGCIFSFLPGTMITLSDGSKKPIEKIEVSDRVLAYNELTRKIESSVVAVTRSHGSDGYYIINNKLKVTSTNPLWISGEWKVPPEIELGDILMRSDRFESVYSIEFVDEKVPIVYNLGILGTHTYFAEDILTHNKLPPIDECMYCDIYGCSAEECNALANCEWDGFNCIAQQSQQQGT
jgi:hypothetical protein